MPPLGPAGSDDGLMGAAVVAVEITGMVGEEAGGAILVDQGLHLLGDVQQGDAVQPVVGQVVEAQGRGAQDAGGGLGGGAPLCQFSLPPGGVRVARPDAVGQEGNVHLGARRRELEDGAATTEDFVIGVGGDDEGAVRHAVRACPGGGWRRVA